MKTIRSGLSSVVALAALVGLVVLLVGLFSNANSNSVGSNTSPVATAVSQVSPLATPNTSSVKLGSPALVHTSSSAGVMIGDQQTLVSFGRQGNKSFTSLLDLSTGRERKIADVALLNAHLSGHWLVYQDSSPITSTISYNRIGVIDIDTGAAILLGGENANQQSPSISGEIVVWIDWRNREKSGVDIYGYDLESGREFPVVTRSGPNSGPKLSGKWMVYVEPTAQGKYLAELRAHLLTTSEDFAIGIIPAPQDATNGTYYAIDGDEIAWTKVEPNSLSLSGLHLYNLKTRIDRSLTEQTAGEPSSRLSISSRKGIVVCGCTGQGWTIFDIFQSPAVQLPATKPMTSPVGAYNLSISGNNLIWWIGLRPGTFEANIYTVSVSR